MEPKTFILRYEIEVEAENEAEAKRCEYLLTELLYDEDYVSALGVDPPVEGRISL